MDGTVYNFDGSVILAIESSMEVCRTLHLSLLPKELFFAALYSSPGTPLYKWFVSKGLSEKEMAESRKTVYEKYIMGEIYTKGIYTLKLPDVKTLEPVEYRIGAEIMDVFDKANEISKQYQKEVIDLRDITLAFAELYEDLFNNIVKEFVPSYGSVHSMNRIDYNGGKYMQEFEIPSDLSPFLTVLNKNYSPSSKKCHICGRDSEVKALTKILMKKTKRNAVFVGEPGVGKTAIMEKFTWNVVTGNCPDELRNCVIVSLDINSIVAGTQYRGTAEERFKKLIEFLNANPEIILFIDEIHLLLGAGACKDGDLDLANAMKPFLARGASRVVGATTRAEYEMYFSKDGALKRRFEKVEVREPRASEIYPMIKNQIALMEEYHGVKISKKLVDDVIMEASCFNFETRNPDRTLDLLDKVMVCAKLSGHSRVSIADVRETFDVKRKQFEKMNERVKWATAYHEAGHYLLNYFSDEIVERDLLAISIIPADDYLGVNVFEINPDITPTYNRKYYIQFIGIMLAGRAAEKMKSKELSSGARSDLKKANKIAESMVTKFAFEDEQSEFRIFDEDSQASKSPAVMRKIDERLDKVLKEAYDYARQVLEEKEEYLHALAAALVERGMLTSSEVEKLFEEVGK